MKSEFASQLQQLMARIDAGDIPGYSECADLIDQIPGDASSSSLSDAKDFLGYLGSPDRRMKIIHAAGTNGKGSVCSYLSYILTEAGYTVGMFTSPHLVRITERFRINGRPAADEVFCRSFADLLLRLRDYPDRSYFPGYFGFLFFMAMLLYERAGVDFLILETGLGGRSDVTNSIHSPVLDVITEIGLDHMQYLGDTIAKIAGEKAGIIRAGVPVVYVNNRPEASAVIEKRAAELGSRRYVTEPECVYDIHFETDEEGNIFTVFSFRSESFDLQGLKIRSAALYQTENAALAIMCAGALSDTGIRLSPEAVRAGLFRAEWEGRMDCVLPGVFVDGAHNADGMEAFLESVRMIPCKGIRYLLFGVVSDKQYDVMIRRILEYKIFEQIFITTLDTPRSVSVNELKAVIRKEAEKLDPAFIPEIAYSENACDALEAILAVKREEDLVFAAGSLYLAGQVMEYISSSYDGRRK